MVLNIKDLQDEFPRGAPIGTRVGGGFTVIAQQVWQAKDRQEIVGLVWEVHCHGCGSSFAQLTPTHPKGFAKECPSCAATPCSHDPAKGWLRPKTDWRAGVKRRGIVERLIVDLATILPMPYPLVDFMDRVTEAMPLPDDGKRDTRRQRAARALESLTKERDGPVRVRQGQVFSID